MIFLRKAFPVVLGLALLLGGMARESRAETYSMEVISSSVIMGEGSGEVTFKIRNTSATGNNLTYIKLDFYIPGANGCLGTSAPYDIGVFSPAPSGWSIDINSGRTGRITYTATAGGIPRGVEQIFSVILTGYPQGTQPIQSAGADQNDSLCAIQVKAGTKTATPPATLPTWSRKGLKTELFATPDSLGVNGTISLDLQVSNRTTAAQNLIVPSTIPFPAGYVTLVSGPAPASLSLAAGASGTFSYSWRADAEGTVTFSGSAGNGTASSYSVGSNPVTIGNFTASLSLDPVKVASGYTVKVVMRVANNGSISLGNVAPSALTFLGTATAILQSGPSPSSIPSLPAGGSGSFEWTYLISGSEGNTYAFTGNAAASGPVSSPTAASPTGFVIVYALQCTPESVAAGSVPPNWTLNLTVINNGVSSVNDIRFVIPAGFVLSGGSGPTGWTRNGSNFTAAAGSELQGASRASFALVFSAVPNPSTNTYYEFRADLYKQPGNKIQGNASDNVQVTVNSLSLSYSPAGPVAADGSSSYTVEALLTSGGVPISGAAVTFSATTGNLSSGSAVTDGLGIATVTLTAPVSSVNTQSTVIASFQGSSDSQVLYFNGYSGPNLLYVGGTLSPTSARVGNPVSFGLEVMNTGTAGINLTTGSYFRFTDGAATYNAYLGSAVAVPGGESRSLVFNSAEMGCFTPGYHYATVSLTDGGTPQVRSVSDPVQAARGIPTGTIILTPVPITIIANGNDTSTINSGIIRDVCGNQAQDGEFITVSADLGTITTTDADPGTPGLQVATSGGTIMFVLQAGTATGTAHISADNSAYGGTASGNTSVNIIVLSPPQITEIKRSVPSGDIKLVWQSDAGIWYDVYFQDTFEGSWSDAADVYASGATAFWFDNGSGTGSHPSSISKRFYRIAPKGTSIFSLGTVGQIKVSIPVGMSLVSLPLVPFNPNINSVIAGQLIGTTNGGTADRIWKWVQAENKYHYYWKFDSGGLYPTYDGKWIEGGSLTAVNLNADEGFWIQNLHSAQSIFFVGEVSRESNRNISISSGMQILGSSYPVDVLLDEPMTTIMQDGASGSTNGAKADRIWIWDNPSNKFRYLWLFDSDGIYPSYDGRWVEGSVFINFSLLPGMGFFYQDVSPTGFNWSYPKPYIFPPNP